MCFRLFEIAEYTYNEYSNEKNLTDRRSNNAFDAKINFQKRKNENKKFDVGIF